MKYSILQRLGYVWAALVMIAWPLTGSTVFAQNRAHNPFWCGLWAGTQFDFESGLNCNKEKSTSTSTSTAPPQTGAYVALGDSVAAGAGLPPTQDSSTSAQCGRSSAAYPHQVAAELGYPLQHIACSGATAGDLATRQSADGPNITAQLDTAFASGTPSLITITAGANDIYWADLIQVCYAYQCDTKTASRLVRANIALLKAKLTYALGEISIRSGGQAPPVYVTGYYNPASTACTNQYPEVTSSELRWISQQTALLNKTIRNASGRYSFTTFVPINFSGHDICSADPWIQTPAEPAPFHPNAAGQQAIAEAVLQAAR